MPLTRKILLILGILAAFTGVVWMGQGSGYFPYPKSSFMIDQRPWIWRGLLLAAAGLAAIVISRRLR
ncbi:hypothetical protein SAMN02745126_05459 [Enhydrobacter aerosaccus]|uniref:MYXO-CTERM domain-containing protein n=1 Tax=Enhydrobacter aerosaccus TaxID=225324 RepID=A0A1T4T0P7_9HYPH|nr:hypothetical protein [Enhydrobacter aerosaccus]SKA34033.1 hypothetical protein SAMN02745126_05459 [Enhydrobacter aerosaccus]